QLTPRASGFARRGQPWFYADDVAKGAVSPPRLVRVHDADGRDLGLGCTGMGKLVLRLSGPWPGHDVPDRETFFQTRLRAAIDARAGRLGPDDGVRLVHGEGDWLPGLVVDRYGPVLVLQATSMVVEQALDAIVPFLAKALGAECVLARHDVAARKHDGLLPEVRLLHGKRLEAATFVEHGLRHTVHPFTGHKTGFYLDQRPARALVRELAKGRSVLDLFCYQGGFALNALAGGASRADAVDQSEPPPRDRRCRTWLPRPQPPGAAPAGPERVPVDLHLQPPHDAAALRGARAPGGGRVAVPRRAAAAARRRPGSSDADHAPGVGIPEGAAAAAAR
ncbi:MAG: class I SAM-dependent methyltransferase, partial [Planctomycetes bacterium]|nr:class I SAM-dependent methyltransferase [Planctomycetota bacterium]